MIGVGLFSCLVEGQQVHSWQLLSQQLVALKWPILSYQVTIKSTTVPSQCLVQTDWHGLIAHIHAPHEPGPGLGGFSMQGPCICTNTPWKFQPTVSYLAQICAGPDGIHMPCIAPGPQAQCWLLPLLTQGFVLSDCILSEHDLSSAVRHYRSAMRMVCCGGFVHVGCFDV